MENIDELNACWHAFLERWPLESLEAMALEEYTAVGTNDAFTYWLEERTEKLGSIWGGSSFKFGIFCRKNKMDKPGGGGLSYTDEYAWYSKYGQHPDAAFQKIRKLIVAVAQSARKGDFAAIDDIDLGPAFRWKLAFLYQDREQPHILPVYKKEALLLALPEAKKIWPVSRLYKELADQRGNKGLFDQADQVWKSYALFLEEQLAPSRAQQWLDEDDRFQAIKSATKYVSGYESASGKQIALLREGQKTTLILMPGAWLSGVEADLEAVRHYAEDEPRNSNLAANAPLLALGNAVVSVRVPSLKALIALADAYEPVLIEKDVSMPAASYQTAPALNQIFYGPPGTGKTYATIEAALAVLDMEFLSVNVGNRNELKERFDAFVAAGQIRFVTFHQSFSYEDFVEGLRAETGDDGQLRYEVVDGVFKGLCEAAAARVTQREEAPLELHGRRIWKMSLGNTKGIDSYIYDECIEKGYVLLGYGGVTNFSGCNSREDIFRRFQQDGHTDVEAGSYAVTAVHIFLNRVKPGDLIVVSDGNSKFRAIGEVTGEYECLDRVEEDDWYGQCRRVKWLRVYSPSLPHDQLMNNRFSQMTLYEPGSGTIDRLKLANLLAPRDGAGEAPKLNRVLVIDEINRGNISRIFGELITLIEPSKRAGSDESLSVVLPYSKEAFSVPDNVYLIGTMNTADRSLAGLDVALRRRFVFKEMMPDTKLLKGVMVNGVSIQALLEVMNQRIEVLLGRDHLLGHAYFLPLRDDPSLTRLEAIFLSQILPLLQEYFFEDWQRIQWVFNDHRKAKGDRFVVNEAPDMQALFGSVNASAQAGVWRVNLPAFKNTAAYAGVISVSSTPVLAVGEADSAGMESHA